MFGRNSAVVIDVKQGEEIPSDGVVIEGFAVVDEAAFSGVSTPCMVEAVDGRNLVMAGGRIVDGAIKVRLSATPKH